MVKQSGRKLGSSSREGSRGVSERRNARRRLHHVYLHGSNDLEWFTVGQCVKGARWPVARCPVPGGQVAGRWPDGQEVAARWPGGQVARWPEVWTRDGRGVPASRTASRAPRGAAWRAGRGPEGANRFSRGKSRQTKLRKTSRTPLGIQLLPYCPTTPIHPYTTSIHPMHSYTPSIPTIHPPPGCAHNG